MLTLGCLSFAGDGKDGQLPEQASMQDWVMADKQQLTELTPVISSAVSHAAPETDLALIEQLMVDVPQLVPAKTCSSDVDVLYCIPDYLPVDLRAKLVVCLIHEGQLKAAKVSY